MPVSHYVKSALNTGSTIRKMFEEGIQLKKKYGADNVFDFSLGNPDVEPPPAFHDVFTKLAREDKKGSHGYMPNAGYPDVRETLAAKAGKEHKVKLDASHIIMSVGAAGALNVILKAILNPEDEIIVSKPYFMEYRPYTENHGGRIVEVDSLPDFNLDVSAINAKLSEKTAAVIINSPHNPTGRVYPAGTIAKLAEVLKAHGEKCGRYPYLIADEPHREVAYTTVPPVLCAYPESLVVYSYSKSLSLAGERIGYIAMSPEIKDKDELVGAFSYATRTLGFVNAPALMQRIVAELTSEHVDVKIYENRRDCFKKVLDSAGIKYAEPEGAFYLFCQVPEGGDDKSFISHLKEHLILGVPGSMFGKPGWLRFAYCVDEKIIQASSTAFKKARETWKM